MFVCQLAFLIVGMSLLSSTETSAVPPAGFIETVAGTGVEGSSGDGGLATDAQLLYPWSIAVDSAGSIFISDISCRIRKVTAGIIQTVAGTGTCSYDNYSGEGGPATDATLGRVYGLATDAAGNLLFSDYWQCAIRSVDAATGTITTVAGSSSINSSCGFSGDGGSALSATFSQPIGIAVATDGTLFISDNGNCRIRMVQNGVVATFAGASPLPASCYIDTGDDGPATDAYLARPVDVDVTSNGDVYVATVSRVRRIRDGLINTVIGGGSVGDHLPPTTVQLISPASVSVDANQNIYVTESQLHNGCSLRIVRNGIIDRFAGTSPIPGLTMCGYNGDGIRVDTALLNQVQSIQAVGDDLYIADTFNHRVRVIRNLDPDGDAVPFGADTCPDMDDPAQENADRNIVDNSPPYAIAVDDKTLPNSDALGDLCDDDDDNDGISDVAEQSGAACGGTTTDPTARDSDGDRVLDGAECALGTDPASATSTPGLGACGASTDSDYDRLSDRVEFCYYNTNPHDYDSDDDQFYDGGGDGCEVASLNGDRIVSSGDQGMLAAGISHAVVYHPNIDLNKDGLLNSGDQGLMASVLLLVSCP